MKAHSFFLGVYKIFITYHYEDLDQYNQPSPQRQEIPADREMEFQTDDTTAALGERSRNLSGLSQANEVPAKIFSLP